VKERDQAPGDPSERLDPGLYSAMAKLAWRMPRTEADVRAAEDLVSRTPGELPERLARTPDLGVSEGRSNEGRGILSRYLRDDGRAPKSPNDERTQDGERPGLEPER
jgi:hypothetical protein